jgi:hypothetical protein
MVIFTGSLRNSDASRWMSVGHVALNISVCDVNWQSSHVSLTSNSAALSAPEALYGAQEA